MVMWKLINFVIYNVLNILFVLVLVTSTLLSFVFIKYAGFIIMFVMFLMVIFLIIIASNDKYEAINYDIGTYLDGLLKVTKRLYEKKKRKELIYKLSKYIEKDQINEISRFMIKKINK